MEYPYYTGQTLDDVMRSVISDILSDGAWIQPSKGQCKELTGVLIEITNPRARISRTETKGKPFSSLGELCWYLSKDNDLETISYYIHRYKEAADGGIIYGGYGPRLFHWKGVNQISQVINTLRKKPFSRQAVIQLFDATDLIEVHNDVPCTCNMQFMIRDSKLQMMTYMRSNDVLLGLPHDVFCFTMLQEIIARTLNVEIGTYKHSVGSLHIYEEEIKDAQQFLNEGWQPTNITMPPMPAGDPWNSIDLLLKLEPIIRNGRENIMDIDKELDPYWADLVRLLQIYRYLKDRNTEAAYELRDKMVSKIYDAFINKKASRT